MQAKKPLTLRTILCFCDHDGQLSTVFAWADEFYRCVVTPHAYTHIFSWPETLRKIDSQGKAYLLVNIEGCFVKVDEDRGVIE